MSPGDVCQRLPFPIAAVYADLDRADASPQTRREAVYFTAYQLMRTVGLTLVGQYLTRPLPPAASLKARDSLNRAIAGVRAPHFTDWIGLLYALRRYAAALGLDFFDPFPAALDAVKASAVEVPPEYGLDHGARWRNLTWLDALHALRNGCAHSGLARDDACRRAVATFRPFLDGLLNAFAFLADYELLVLRSRPDDDPALVQCLRGATPPEPGPVEVDDGLYAAFQLSPVVFRAADGRLQPLFPLFHGHLEGEPLHCYDGAYLRDDPVMRRRTVYFLGNGDRLPLDDADAAGRVRPPAPADAGERLRGLLDGRAVPWRLRREDVAPWTLRDTVNDYARRTLDDVTDVKYLPACYLDRPRLSEPLWQTATAEGPVRRAFLLTGRAGSGKTALLCDLVRRLLAEDDHLVFFLRGDGLLREVPGGNLLVANLLHKIGLEPGAFATAAEFFAHLEARRREDRVADRRLVLVFDALNEAPEPQQVLREALELVAAARQYAWLRVVLSARDEFLLVWSGRRGELEANPFHPVRELFVPPPDDPQRPPRPEDPPAWPVPAFTADEAATVYGRYQAAKAAGQPLPACATPWAQLPPAARTGLLGVPLHLHLWMTTFDGRPAPAVAGEAELFDAYLADLRLRFDRFWPAMAAVLDHMLQTGRMELDDGDAHALRDGWQRGRTAAEQRRELSQLEVACASGVMDKRAREEGGGYRIPHQGLREQLLYARLKERDPGLSPAGVAAWLALPETEDLAGALARVADDLWLADRTVELAAFVSRRVGAAALGQMLAGRLERDAPDERLRQRLERMLAATPDTGESVERMRSLVLNVVPERLVGLAVTLGLRVLWETSSRWLENQVKLPSEEPHGLLAVAKKLLSWKTSTPRPSPAESRTLRALAISYNSLGDIYRDLRLGEQALTQYRRALELAERLHRSDPQRADFARNLSVSWHKLGDVYRDLGQAAQALDYYRQARAIHERLHRAEPQRANFAFDLSISYTRMGDIYRARGQGEQALTHFRQALELDRQLHRAEPQRAIFAWGLFTCLYRLGDVYRDLGQGAQALDYYQQARAVAERLHQVEPQRADFAHGLSVSYERLGKVYQNMGQGAQALEYYHKCREIAEGLHRAEPQRTDFASQLAGSYQHVGDVYRALGQGEQALDYFQKALAIAQQLQWAEPQRADFAWHLVWSLERLGHLTGDRRRLVQARDLLRKLRAEGRLPHQKAAQRLDRLEHELAD
jgi:tetratricopeptide (TPR) repeat protein